MPISLENTHLSNYLSVDFGKLRMEDVFLFRPVIPPKESVWNSKCDVLWKMKDDHQARETVTAKSVIHDADERNLAIDQG